MLKPHYYCLIAGLPDLILNETHKGLNSIQFRNELAEQLTKSDFRLLKLLYLPADNKNLLNLLLKNKAEFDPAGNYPEEYLTGQISNPTDIVAYQKQFITEFNFSDPDKSARQTENTLLEYFYSFILKTHSDFIKQWFQFDRKVRNLLAAVNCYRYGFDAGQQLIQEKNDDEFVRFLQKKAPTTDLFTDDQLPFPGQIFQIVQSDREFSEKEKAIDSIRWNFLDEITVFNYFTIEKIMSYVLKLQIIDRWQNLDHETGKIFLRKLIHDLEMSYSLDSEFRLSTLK
ncbi:MAG: DUF2764 family protein [Prolixibacteraceae bacterium]